MPHTSAAPASRAVQLQTRRGWRATVRACAHWATVGLTACVAIVAFAACVAVAVFAGFVGFCLCMTAAEGVRR